MLAGTPSSQGIALAVVCPSFDWECPVLQPVLQCLPGAGSTFSLNAPIGSKRGAGQNLNARRRHTSKTSRGDTKAAAAVEARLGAGPRAPGGDLQYGY